MSTWSFYSLSDGLFTGTTYSGPERYLEQYTPEGCGAVEGRHDHLCRRVELGKRRVVPWKPPRPDDTPESTHRWDEATERWVAEPTLAAQRAQLRAVALRKLEGMEAAQHRAVREFILGGDHAVHIARQRLQTLEARAAAVRAIVDRISKARTEAAMPSRAEIDAI